MNTEKTTKIMDLLGQLYCFEQTEIDAVMKRVPAMKEEGLDKLIVELETGLEDQNKLLKSWTERDPQFSQKLSDFAGETAKSLMDEFEVKEKDTAENILSEIV